MKTPLKSHQKKIDSQVRKFRKEQTDWVYQFKDTYSAPAKVYLDYRGLTGVQIVDLFIEVAYQPYSGLLEQGLAILTELRAQELLALQALRDNSALLPDLVFVRDQIWRVEKGLQELEQEYDRLYSGFVWAVTEAQKV